jgi:hypothetical protein
MSGTRKWASSLTITKIDQEQRLVEGFASSERIDSQDDIVDAQAMKDALPEYMQYANLREMHHGPQGELETTAAGTVIKAEVIEGEVEVGGITYRNPLHIICKVVDDAAWEKVKEGVYKGFSIGGKILKAIRETIDGKSIRRITKLMLYEISLVDRPANEDARILLWKVHNMSDLEKAAGDADLSKPIAGIQAARNAAELSGDLATAELLTQAIGLLLQANGDASQPEEGSPEEEASETPAEAQAEGDVAAAEGAPADDGQLLASAKATINKAGRALNAGNMEAMKSTIKSLLNMLASAGDETAAKALALYTPAPQPGVDKAANAEDVSKAMAAALEPIFKAITDSLSEVAKDVESLKRQPRAGGPASRVVANKELPGTAQAEPVHVTKAQAQANLAVIKKLAATDPDPQRRASYAAKAAELEKSLT